MELDATLMEASFPDLLSRKRFLQLVLMLLQSVQGGLDRKYKKGINSILTLLATCDELMPHATSSGSGTASGGGDGVSASASGGSSANMQLMGGVKSRSSFRNSGCPCLNHQTFAQWLHTPCAPDAGVVNIEADVN